MRQFVAMLLVVGVAAGFSQRSGAQTPPLLSSCDGADRAPACDALRGDRAEGWTAQSRAEVMAQHGMVVTSQPLAAQAGLDMLKRGGNAIDAAVSAAAVLGVVEPMNVGIGGDLFAIVYIAKEHRLYALNASGTAVTGATPERLAALGYKLAPASLTGGMPIHGVTTVTTPGTVWGWGALESRFGKLGFGKALQAAIDYADGGFPLSQRIAHDWRLPKALPLTHCCTEFDPDSVVTWYVNGKPPAVGQVFRNADLARTLKKLQRGGAQAFYRGEIAAAIVKKSSSLGGSMTREDLAGFRGEWTEPARSTYHGYDIYELPPPSQAWATLELLNILEACVPSWSPGRSLADLGPQNPTYWHLLIEAKKLAFADLMAVNADPNFARVPWQELVSKDHARSLCGRVDPNRSSATATPEPKGAGDTVVLSTADADGNVVALVSSNASEFGSGITVPGYGFVLHNRGVLFSLDPQSPNVIAPGKRPFNTLSAGFVMKGDQPLLSLLLMGGDMQAQGHAQILVNLFDLGANLQMASDMARFRHTQASNKLTLEQPLLDRVGKDLAAMGHQLTPADSRGMGGFQGIWIQPGDKDARSSVVYRAGSDHRKDGQAVGW
ncbi:MAG: Gamma-glutamyltransferase [Rhodospirillales bacterium]|nr:Gamma-glutamyltransferase [Rhodospirillales bacterium]